DSLPPVPELPLVSPFLYSDDSKADNMSKPAEQRPERHEITSHDTLAPSSDFPLAPVVAPPGIRRWPTILVRLGEAIPFGRPYRSHPNGLHRLLTARKRVGPIPAHFGIGDGVIAHTEDGIGMGVEIVASDIRRDNEEFEAEASAVGTREIVVDPLATSEGKSVDTKFQKSSVIRQPNAFKSQRPSVLGKPTTFSNYFVRKDFLKSTSVTQTHESNDFSKPLTAQTLPSNKKSILKNTNVLAPEMYKIHTDHT
nr:hypothetical protein [Tanacetum cinerariifolium]